LRIQVKSGANYSDLSKNLERASSTAYYLIQMPKPTGSAYVPIEYEMAQVKQMITIEDGFGAHEGFNPEACIS